MIGVHVDRRWRVRLVGEFELPFDAASAWESLRDFRRFACQDLFHRSIVLDGPTPAAGVPFVIEHELLGVRILRPGRILHWHEARSYAFSDLSRRDPRKGFPHVYIYTLLPVDEERCRFRLEVRGRWTARFLGRALTRLWLAAILAKTTISIRTALLADALTRLRYRDPPSALASGGLVEARGSGSRREFRGSRWLSTVTCVKKTGA